MTIKTNNLILAVKTEADVVAVDSFLKSFGSSVVNPIRSVFQRNQAVYIMIHYSGYNGGLTWSWMPFSSTSVEWYEKNGYGAPAVLPPPPAPAFPKIDGHTPIVSTLGVTVGCMTVNWATIEKMLAARPKA